MTPFFQVFINAESGLIDISNLITHFKYEDCTKEDDLLELKIHTDFVENLQEETELLKGIPLIFKFGYIGGDTSLYKSIKVSDIKYKYAGNISITIIALDTGNKLKKVPSIEIWKDQSSKDILQTICDRHNLELNFEGTPTHYKSLPQGNLSDFEFIQQLAIREDKGNYIAYINNNKLNFVRRGLNKESVVTLTYKDSNSEILSFTPNEQSSNQKGRATVVGFDPMEKKPVVGNSDDKGIHTGDFIHVYDEFAEKIGIQKDGEIHEDNDSIFGTVGGLIDRFMHPSGSKSELSNMAQSHKQSDDLEMLKSTLVVMGTPLMESNDIITILGVFDRHKGNYLNTKVVHTISKAGYKTTTDLEKNGKYVGVNRSTKPNTKKGKDVMDDKQEIIHRYDENGIKVAVSAGDVYSPPTSADYNDIPQFPISQ